MALNGKEYAVTAFEGNNISIWRRRVNAIFSAKELGDYLEREADLSKTEEISKSKKAYALLLTLLEDRILARFIKKIWRAKYGKFFNLRMKQKGL